MQQPANLRLLQLGILAEMRNPAIRTIMLIAAVFGAAMGWVAGPGAGPAAVALTALLARAVGLAATLHLAYGANRDLSETGGAAYRSKPMNGAYWVLHRCLAGVCTWLAVLALAFGAAALLALFRGGPAAIPAYLLGFVRAALVVAPLAAAGFAMARMMRSPLGGIIIAFFWFSAIAGGQFIPVFLQPEYAQNNLLIWGAALLLLAIAALWVERLRRGEFRSAVPAVAGALVALLLFAAGASVALAREPDRLMRFGTVEDLMSLQYARRGAEMPGFWLHDGKGGLVRTRDHAGKILMVYIFDARSSSSAAALTALEKIARKHGPQGVQPIAIAISPDHGDGPALAWTGGHTFPIAYDRAVMRLSPPSSSIVDAFDIQELPLLVVTNRRRRIVEYRAFETVDESVLSYLAAERLREEPPVP